MAAVKQQDVGLAIGGAARVNQVVIAGVSALSLSSSWFVAVRCQRLFLFLQKFKAILQGPLVLVLVFSSIVLASILILP